MCMPSPRMEWRRGGRAAFPCLGAMGLLVSVVWRLSAPAPPWLLARGPSLPPPPALLCQAGPEARKGSRGVCGALWVALLSGWCRRLY